MNENKVQDFWQKHPCGDMQVGGLEKFRRNYETFFREYDKFRYTEEKHILKCLDNIMFKNKNTLEIGLGQGADSEQIIRRGAIWSGVDLTEESVERVQVRLTLKDLPYHELKQGSVLNLPFDDNSFDIVFSHGVLHHVPDIDKAQSEIHRVLKPDGELIAMLYAKVSLNYLFSISVLRRIGLVGLALTGCKLGGIYDQHLDNVSEISLWRYLSMENFIHKNTDGPLNPYSKVYNKAGVIHDFKNFKIERLYKQFMHAPPLPISWLPLERILGWHLWVHMKPVDK